MSWDFDFNLEKNKQLRESRAVGFEDMIFQIANGWLLDIIEHKNQDKYPDQKMFVVEMNNYAYLVPYVEQGEKVFLKTIFPSRKATKRYLKESGDGI